MLSVIVPTRNRSRQLELALRSFERQTLPWHLFEVIVVDNGSTDNTRSVVAYAARDANVKYYYEPRPGLHVGRHVGFRKANGNILIYVDDDIEAFPTMLEAINDAFGRNDVALVGGKCIPKFEAEPPQWLTAMWTPDAGGNRILGALSLIDLGEQPKEINPRFVFGCNFSIRRDVLSGAQGFHPDGMPKELIRFRGDGETHVSDFISVNGYKAYYTPAASIYHWVPSSRMTVDYFCQRAFNQGVSDSYTAIRKEAGVGLLSNPTSSPESTGPRSTWRRITNRVWRKGRRMVASLQEQMLPSARGDEQRRRKIADAYLNGYKFHQSVANDDDSLQAWILRADYWDCDIPPSIDGPLGLRCR